MLGFGKRTPDERPPIPRWLGWVLFGFILYLVAIGNLNKAHKPQEVPTETATVKPEAERDYPAIRSALDMHNWQRALNPMYDKGLTVRDFTVGKGRAVGCGDEVTIMLRGADAKGNDFDPEQDETKPLTFTVGQGKTYPAVEQAVIGMREGGERNVDAPPVLVWGKEKSAKSLTSLQLRMTLNELKPVIEEGSAPLLVSADERVKGTGARCGETIQVDMRMWESDKEKPVRVDAKEITLGQRAMAIGLDYALPGIKQGELRTIVLPPSMQLHEGNDSPFDGKQMRLVEVTRK